MRRPGAPGRGKILLYGAPAIAFFIAFWILPFARLFSIGASGDEGLRAYAAIVTHPNYLRSFLWTTGLSAVVTAAALVLGGVTGVFLHRHPFPGRRFVVGMIALPMAFPGVVVAFLVIIIAGRQGVLTQISESLGGPAITMAYGISGLAAGYLYFSLPRVILTVMAASEKIDRALIEAARSLGATPWRIAMDVEIPALSPALGASAALCFATSMGAFGTAFTLATKITVLPIAIYNEFTNYANFASAASLSIVLGIVTWGVLLVARSLAAAPVMAGA